MDSQAAAEFYRPNLSAARALAFAASSSRFFGGAFVSSAPRSLIEIAVTSSTAARKIASLDFDGLLKPVIFRAYCRAAARVSSSVTGGSKLKSVLIFLHMQFDLTFQNFDATSARIGFLQCRVSTSFLHSDIGYNPKTFVLMAGP
jgi:hypothetical protein